MATPARISAPADRDFPIAEYLRDHTDVEFEFVVLGGVRTHGVPPRYFLADQRQYEHQDTPWICIHNWTHSPASLLRNLMWVARFKDDPVHKVFVFEAQNRGQIAVWLEQFGYTTKFMGKRPDIPHTEKRQIVDTRERKIAQEEAIIRRAQERIDRIAALPEEPTTEDPDGALVVWFEHKFNDRSRTYTYAAVRANDGLWYTTGPASPKGYTWDQLIEWHMSEVNVDSTMWVAREWEPVL